MTLRSMPSAWTLLCFSIALFARLISGFVPIQSYSNSRIWRSTRAISAVQSTENLIEAVEILQRQVADLVALVKNSPSTPLDVSIKPVASTEVNGAAKKSSSIAGTAATAPLGEVLVPVSAAEARIQAFMANKTKEMNGFTTTILEKTSVAKSVVPVEKIESPIIEKVTENDGNYQITINFDGSIHTIKCDSDTTILEAALEAGIDLPHSCMSGSCLTCPGKLTRGNVDQSDGVLDDDQINRGLMLTCVSYPLSDLAFDVISEDQLD